MMDVNVWVSADILCCFCLFVFSLGPREGVVREGANWVDGVGGGSQTSMLIKNLSAAGKGCMPVNIFPYSWVQHSVTMKYKKILSFDFTCLYVLF